MNWERSCGTSCGWAREPIYLIVGAGLLLILLDARPAWRLPRRKPPAADSPAPGIMHGAAVLTLAARTLGTLASGGVLVSLGLFFLKTGALVFGSGLAIVPLLRDGVVTQHHWLNQAQFLDAVAMGLLTPGPVVITAAFIGFLVGGPAGALIATVAIFTPIYLGVVLPGRWFIRHRDNPQIKDFVTGATAAAGGALCGAVVVRPGRPSPTGSPPPSPSSPWPCCCDSRRSPSPTSWPPPGSSASWSTDRCSPPGLRCHRAALADATQATAARAIRSTASSGKGQVALTLTSQSTYVSAPAGVFGP